MTYRQSRPIVMLRLRQCLCPAVAFSNRRTPVPGDPTRVAGAPRYGKGLAAMIERASAQEQQAAKAQTSGPGPQLVGCIRRTAGFFPAHQAARLGGLRHV